jgi:hypothetical protein
LLATISDRSVERMSKLGSVIKSADKREESAARTKALFHLGLANDGGSLVCHDTHIMYRAAARRFPPPALLGDNCGRA